MYQLRVCPVLATYLYTSCIYSWKFFNFVLFHFSRMINKMTGDVNIYGPNHISDLISYFGKYFFLLTCTLLLLISVVYIDIIVICNNNTFRLSWTLLVPCLIWSIHLLERTVTILVGYFVFLKELSNCLCSWWDGESGRVPAYGDGLLPGPQAPPRGRQPLLPTGTIICYLHQIFTWAMKSPGHTFDKRLIFYRPHPPAFTEKKVLIHFAKRKWFFYYFFFLPSFYPYCIDVFTHFHSIFFL